MQSSRMVIAGAGGHARVVIEAVRSEGRWTVEALTDPTHRGEVLDVPIVGPDESLARLHEDGFVAALVGVGSVGRPTQRVLLFERLAEIGFVRPAVCHGDAIVSESATVGDGTVVLAGSIINAEASIGCNAIINTAAVVEHNCRVGDHVHVAPRAAVGGDVTVGAMVHVGMGAVVLEGRRIGEGCVIGAGAVVTKDLPPNTLCVGVPASAIRSLGNGGAAG